MSFRRWLHQVARLGRFGVALDLGRSERLLIVMERIGECTRSYQMLELQRQSVVRRHHRRRRPPKATIQQRNERGEADPWVRILEQLSGDLDATRAMFAGKCGDIDR